MKCLSPSTWQFAHDQRGSNVVEFALVMPFFAMTVLASFQVGYIGWAQNRLEAAVREGSRAGVTGDTGPDPTASRDEFIMHTVEDAMRGLRIAENQSISLEAKAYPSYQTLNKPGEPFDDANNNGICDAGETYYDYDGVPGRSLTDIGSPGSGGSGDVVRYTVTFPLKLFVPVAGSLFGNNGVLNLESTTVVKNENFAAGAPPASGTC
jgi:Flp pilus assembly pilin Flp